ncbi:MAG: ATP-binding protein [Chloroflexi bacterium]|nr:ATP-binding protein [Chloroflexota bacterium]
MALDPALRGTIQSAIDGRRCVFVAGLPASGKSLLVREIARVAADRGRIVHLLHWDVARLPFDTPQILARYPEIGGVTHSAIRLAVGRWARGAVLRWHRAHPDPRRILVGETPLVGGRLMELARPYEDEAEQLLAGDATCFVIPVPSREVRRTIEDARSRDMAEARDAKSAPPDLVRAHWDEIEHVASALGAPARTPGGYDAELYAEAYRRVLRHRHVLIAPLAQVMTGETSAAAIGAALRPSPDEVAEAMRDVERLSLDEIERSASEWYRT